MNAKRPKRWLRRTLLLFLIGSAVLWVAWIFLPHLLSTFINRKLASTELQVAEVRLSDVSTNTLHLEYAQFAGPGWSLQVKDTDFFYDLSKLLAARELKSVRVGELTLSVVRAELDPDSENTLSLEMLRDLPFETIHLETSTLILETESKQLLQSSFRGHLLIQKESGIEGLLTQLSAKLESADGKMLLNIPELSDEEGLVKLIANPELSQTKLTLNIPAVDLKSDFFQIGGISIRSNLETNYPLDAQGMESIRDDPHPLLSTLTGNLLLNCNLLKADTLAAEWITLETQINPDDSSELMNAHVLTSIGLLHAVEETLEQIRLETSVHGDLDHLASDGSLRFFFDGIEGGLNFTSLAQDLLQNPSLKGEYSIPPIVLDYSDVVARRLPSLKDLSVSGTMTASGAFEVRPAFWDATAKIRVREGSATMPSSKLTISNFELNTELLSLRKRISVPGTTLLTMERIQAGDISFHENRVALDLPSATKVEVTEARSNFFNGTASIVPSSITLDPISFDSRLQFERLSLDSITNKMAFFDGSMEGQVSGFLPLSFQDGRFQFGEGLLSLSEGSGARLRYNTEGLFKPKETTEKPGFIQRLSNQIMGRLRLAPETVVEDALSDLRIHTLRIELLPEESPETPVRIRLGGEGKSGTTLVPFNLDTNINGTLDELVTFLLRMSSLGTPSLEN